AFVARVGGVALDPVPTDAVAGSLGVQGLPEIEVLDRLLASAPALGLPAGQPFAHAELDVPGVGVQVDLAGLLESPKPLDGRGQLHLVIRGGRAGTGQLAAGSAVAQDDAPTPRTGVALASAVGVDGHL